MSRENNGKKKSRTFREDDFVGRKIRTDTLELIEGGENGGWKGERMARIDRDIFRDAVGYFASLHETLCDGEFT